MGETRLKKHHIAVLAFPFATHAAPLLSLVRRLSSSAPPNTLFSFFSTPASNASLFPGRRPIANILPRDVWDGLPDGYHFSGNPEEPVGLFLRAVPGNYRAALVDTGVEFSCMITDAFLCFAADLAEEMGVPWVPFWTAGPRPLYVHVEVDNIRRQMGENGPGDKTLDFLPDFSKIRTIDIPAGVIDGDDKAPIPYLLNQMGAYLPRATAVAINSFEELDPIVAKALLESEFKEFLNVGPLALTCPPPSPSNSDENKCLEFLDNHENASVVYISFGSITVPPANETTQLAEALEEKKLPFLWSFRGNPDEYLPKGFLERTKDIGKIVSWAPQLRVLQHSSVGVLVTHGGWNSVTESIIGGVPMICRPFFGDQTLNVRTLEAIWKIGIGIEGGKFTKDGAIKAFETVLSGEAGREMKENIRIKQELAFAAAKPGGSSTGNLKRLVEIITQ